MHLSDLYGGTIQDTKQTIYQLSQKKLDSKKI